jgi:RimJ/RimL family protein N-acetyltransferase
MTAMPVLETERLRVRPLAHDDLAAVCHILDHFSDEGASAAPQAERQQWLEWTILGNEQFARLHQPPYGERAVALRQTGQVIGLCGFVPCLEPFEQLAGQPQAHYTTEFSLNYAIAPAFRRQGYASEAAGAMIDYAFRELRLNRIVATTEYDNAGSQAVMRRLGMRIERNPYPEPPWLQVVGFLDHPSTA